MSIRFYVNDVQPFCGSLRPKHTEDFLVKSGIVFPEDDANIIEPQKIKDVQGLINAIKMDCNELDLMYNVELDDLAGLTEVTVEQI